MTQATSAKREGFKRFLLWREEELKKGISQTNLFCRLLVRLGLLRSVSRPCVCIMSCEKPTWTSNAHHVLFHVCENHAAEFGIPLGPYWEETIEELK